MLKQWPRKKQKKTKKHIQKYVDDKNVVAVTKKEAKEATKYLDNKNIVAVTKKEAKENHIQKMQMTKILQQ